MRPMFPKIQASVTENHGNTATGTATFVDSQAMMMGESSEPVQGTFEVDGDRGE